MSGWRPRERSSLLRGVAVGLLVLSSLLVVGSTAGTYWICNLAVYHCPETGCGGAPLRSCAASEAQLPLLIAGGLVSLGLGLELLLRESRRLRATAIDGSS